MTNKCYINEDKLKIIIRMRPILKQEDTDQFVELQDDNTLQIKRPGNHTLMKFNNILPPTSTQKDVFNLVEDSIKQFLNGINITIFAYGQTGAGKTYSMIGNYSPKDSQQNLNNFLSSKQRGILSRSLEMIMFFLHKKQKNRIYVSFFQIYNQKIFDLYKYTRKPLDILQSKNGEISIPELFNQKVSTMEEAIQYLMVGLKNRTTRSTQGNSQSSRSHSIFRISLEKEDDNGQIINSSLRIVDLAGSQKFKIPSDLSPAEKQTRIQELTNINGSLSCLGHCISSLIEKSRTHIPFRNSKLTRILSDSLQGNGKMRFIICISPSRSAYAETFSTLQFANRAKKAIFQRSQMKSLNLSKKQSSQNQEVTTLRKQLQKQRQQRIALQKQLNNILNQRPQGMLKQNMYLKKENEKLKQQLKQLIAKKQNNKSCSPQLSTRNHQQDTLPNNQNFSATDLKHQMLKLPIFQDKKSLSILQHQLQHSKYIYSITNARDLAKQVNKSVSAKKKKTDFEKQIKRFIDADSPSEFSHQIDYSPKKTIKQFKQNYHGTNINKNVLGLFQRKQNIIENPRKSNKNFVPSHMKNSWKNDEQCTKILNNQKEHNGDNFSKKRKNTIKKLENSQKRSIGLCEKWQQHDDTQEFIEQACDKMNLPDFKDLKLEMDRAKQELMLLKQRDDEISKKKKVTDLRLT